MSTRRRYATRHTSHTVDTMVISPGQIVAGMIGLFLIIMGGVVLARTGFGSMTGNTTEVLGFGHTTLMGLIDLVAGLMFLGAAATVAVRGPLTGMSLLAIAFGAIVAIEPGTFESTLGGGREIGALYLVIGLIGLLAAVLFPTRTVEAAEVVEDDATDATDATDG